ncbi:MAG: transposase, partial [Bacteroidota bacterium]
RNSMRYIAHKHSKEFLEDLKTIYKAPTKEVAESNLQQLDEKWSTKYLMGSAPLSHWGLTAQQLTIRFGARMPLDLTLHLKP